MRPPRFLFALLALAFAIPAFAQEKPKEKEASPEAPLILIGGISLAYIVEVHAKIGYVIDAYASKKIEVEGALLELLVTQSMLKLIDRQIGDVVKTVKLSDGDVKFFEGIQRVLNDDQKSIESIFAYWKGMKEEDAKAYETSRLAAMKTICTMMDYGRADKKAMQGTWKATKAASDGDEAPAETVKAITFTIKDDVIEFKMGPETSSAKVYFDILKSPKHLYAEVIDGKEKGKTRLGIYEITGDVLKFCWSRGDKRPTKFSGDQGPDVVYFELNRSKE